MMTKQDFIALADHIKNNPVDYWSVGKLADFCYQQNPAFNRDRWLGYIAGTNGKNGGSIPAKQMNKWIDSKLASE
jgi:hypothetical protein